jgi:hypothetical protein
MALPFVDQAVAVFFIACDGLFTALPRRTVQHFAKVAEDVSGTAA